MIYARNAAHVCAYICIMYMHPPSMYITVGTYFAYCVGSFFLFYCTLGILYLLGTYINTRYIFVRTPAAGSVSRQPPRHGYCV